MTALADPPELDDVAPAAADDGWRINKNGRQYVPRRGRPGTVLREGNETVEEAHARDATGPKDKGPRKRKVPTVPKAPAPQQKSLQELEFMLLEALQAPGALAAMKGDLWVANHFMGERSKTLARNLTTAAEHNPWLRAKLEAAVTGGEGLLVKLLTLMPVLAASVVYALPPLLFYLRPGFVPPETYAMFGIPDKPTPEVPVAPPAESTESAAAPEAAAVPLAA